ncbi:DUF1501 domain-containing protein [Maioricimonas sp. JC845]|uniref:DUF1501 domain-containing protein n=1 Tax=Maioricimonas sp. JC845 TaxID=3232138 RepID=UPI00345A7C5A
MHHPARAKRVLQMYMVGGASQCDLFDYKPALEKYDGKPWDPGEEVELFQSKQGLTLASPWTFRQYGDCGRWISSIFAPLGEFVDDMTFVYSMTSRSNVHALAMFLQSTGFMLPGFPSAGSWISYGLGSMNHNLPTYVVLVDSLGPPAGGAKNWGAGFLSAAHQGTRLQSGPTPLSFVTPPANDYITPESETRTRKLLSALNRRHADHHMNDTRLAARIDAYELAARLQTAGPKALDISSEPAHIQKEYGLDNPATRDFGTNCLLARRLLEHDVRFVQIWSGTTTTNEPPQTDWDSHKDIRDHANLAAGVMPGMSALLRDLKRTGLLEDTIVHWTTEFGRMPCAERSLGRDHNPHCFTNWFAGGGFKRGVSFGATDEWSYKAIEKPVTCHDVYATILYLLGIDHKKLTVRHSGIDRRLTDVHGKVLHEICA